MMLLGVNRGILKRFKERVMVTGLPATNSDGLLTQESLCAYMATCVCFQA